MATGAVFSFSLGVLFFIDTIGLDKEMLIPIYSSSAIIFSLIMSVFIYTMVVATAASLLSAIADILHVFALIIGPPLFPEFIAASRRVCVTRTVNGTGHRARRQCGDPDSPP